MKNINEILNESDDESLLINVLEYITRKESFSIDKVTETERNVVAVVTAQAIIDNGGIRYFFESEFEEKPDYQIFISAYNAIGAEHCAEAIQQALSLFPNDTPPLDATERKRHLDSIFNQATDASRFIAELENRISGDENNYALVVKYIRENSDQIM